MEYRLTRRVPAVLAVLAWLVLSVSAASAQTTVTIGANTGDTYTGAEHTKLREGQATTNYYGSSNLEVFLYGGGDSGTAIAKFSGLSNIPSGATITSATLYLYVSFANTTHTIATNRLLRDWVPAEATWNQWSTGNNWTTGGAQGSGTDMASSATDSQSVTATGGYQVIATGAGLVADIQGFVDGSLSNYGWVLRRTDGSADSTAHVFHSASSGSSGERPYLSVTYTTSATAALTGTVTAAIAETDIVTGGKTIILTLTGDTWVTAGATFDGQRQNIINGCDSAQAEGTGWDAVVKAGLATSTVVRTSGTVVTITLSAFGSYNITATETVTCIVPSTALVGAAALTASPTFTISAAGGGGATISRQMLMGVGE